MIKTINTWAMKDGLAGTHRIEDSLADAKKAGFAGLELCIGTEGTFHTSMSESECQAIAGKIEASGLEVQTVAAGISWGCNPVSNDPAVCRESIALHAAALERTAWVGAQAMLMVPGVVGSPIAPDEKVRYDHAIDRCREAVSELLETAERVGVDLCLENVWNGMFYSPLELRDFIDSFKSERLGVYFDVGNCLGYQQYPPHWIELLGKRIKRVHIKDFTESFGWTGSYAFNSLGAGQVPWLQTMQALRDIGYDATLVAEMMPWDASLLARTSVSMDVIMAL